MELVQSKVLRSIEVLHGVAALFETRPDVSRREFADFVHAALDRQPELHALAWTPRVPRERRAEYEAKARADGWTDFQITVRDKEGRMVSAGDADDYYPVYYIEPAERNRPAAGFDVASNPIRYQTLKEAATTGCPTATPAMKLVQDGGRQLGLVVYAPVRNPRGLQPAGFCSAVFGVEDLLGASAAGADVDELEFLLTEEAKSAEPLFRRPAQSPVADIEAFALVDVAGQSWRLTLRPTQAFVSAHSNGHAATILGAGLMISALLSGYTRRAMKGRSAIEQEVRVAHGPAIARSGRAPPRRGRRPPRRTNYREIFENSVEGIFQTTPDGHYLCANRALARIYGYDTSEELIAHLADIAVQLYVQAGPPAGIYRAGPEAWFRRGF